MLASASPASAHDELVASTPAAGAQLASAPSEVSLTFSADVLTLGAAVIVADGEGRDWAATDPVVADGVVTVGLSPDMPDAGYEIRWRVVSEDGHPVSGLVPFTVGDAAPLTRTPAADATTGEMAPTDASATDASATDAAAQEQDTQADQGSPRIVLIGIGGAIAALAVFALIHLLRRKKGASTQ